MAKSVIEQVNAEMEVLQTQLSQFKTSVEYLNNAKSTVEKAIEKVDHTNEDFNSRIDELKETYHSFINLSDSIKPVILKIETINFPERLDSIEKSIQQTLDELERVKEATIAEVQEAAITIKESNFDGKFSKLQGGLDKSVKSNQNILDSLIQMKISKRIDESKTGLTLLIEEKHKLITNNIKEIDPSFRKLITNLNLPQKLNAVDSNLENIISNMKNLHEKLSFVDGKIQTLNIQQEKIAKKMEIEIEEKKQWQKRMQMMIVVTNIIVLITFLILFFSRN